MKKGEKLKEKKESKKKEESIKEIKEEQKKQFSGEDIKKKYPNIDFEKLKQEQLKLAKKVSLKDAIDFSQIDKIAACTNAFFENKIVSACVLFDDKLEILQQEYFFDRLKFPYVSGFRAYRELPTMIEAFLKLDEKPDIVFMQGHGISHPRLGIASHFSLLAGEISTIGIADSLLDGNVKGKNIILNGKKVGKILKSKEGSNPLYVSPGNKISIKTAFELTKKYVRLPHKLPEPLHITLRYAKKMRDELRNKRDIFPNKNKEKIEEQNRQGDFFGEE